jgi:hypothetical protein
VELHQVIATRQAEAGERSVFGEGDHGPRLRA